MTKTPQEYFGLLGGTFDPIHHGHLRLALEVKEHLDLDLVHLIPSADPPHRAAVHAPATLRFEMTKVACDRAGQLVANDCELHRAGPSYTLDTLAAFRESYPRASIVFIVGDDAYAQLPTWHRWQELTDFAHIVVVNRPGVEVEQHADLAAWTARHKTDDLAILKKERYGRVYFLIMPVLDIASSTIRDRSRRGLSIEFLTPLPVVDLILEHGLYQET